MNLQCYLHPSFRVPFRRLGSLRAVLGTTQAAALAVLVLAPLEARAGCCRLLKVDPETASATLRACEPSEDGGCSPLFAGTLATGEAASVCTSGSTLVYEEQDPVTGAFSPATEAVCDGADVEI